MIELYHDCRFACESRITVTEVGMTDKQFLCPSFQLEKRPTLNDCIIFVVNHNLSYNVSEANL